MFELRSPSWIDDPEFRWPGVAWRRWPRSVAWAECGESTRPTTTASAVVDRVATIAAATDAEIDVALTPIFAF
jgi:hypothetical protein